ncbi:MAG: hypothetical protein KDI65_02455 [Alphaproteobacteria bacterium]|nr:hypothetical protein [Alphaproteobacteria bacterium]
MYFLYFSKVEQKARATPEGIAGRFFSADGHVAIWQSCSTPELQRLAMLAGFEPATTRFTVDKPKSPAHLR